MNLLIMRLSGIKFFSWQQKVNKTGVDPKKWKKEHEITDTEYLESVPEPSGKVNVPKNYEPKPSDKVLFPKN